MSGAICDHFHHPGSIGHRLTHAPHAPVQAPHLFPTEHITFLRYKIRYNMTQEKNLFLRGFSRKMQRVRKACSETHDVPHGYQLACGQGWVCFRPLEHTAHPQGSVLSQLSIKFNIQIPAAFGTLLVASYTRNPRMQTLRDRSRATDYPLPGSIVAHGETIAANGSGLKVHLNSCELLARV